MDQVHEEIEKILDEFVRPELESHGGNVSIADIRDGVLYVRMTGHCSHCPSATLTLESVVKEEIMKRTTSIKDVFLQEEVSDELIDFAKTFFGKSRNRE